MSVTDAREVIKDEVWCVDVATLDLDGNESRNESFYILEETCEVIGRPTSPARKSRRVIYRLFALTGLTTFNFVCYPRGFIPLLPRRFAATLNGRMLKSTTRE